MPCQASASVGRALIQARRRARRRRWSPRRSELIEFDVKLGSRFGGRDHPLSFDLCSAGLGPGAGRDIDTFGSAIHVRCGHRASTRTMASICALRRPHRRLEYRHSHRVAAGSVAPARLGLLTLDVTNNQTSLAAAFSIDIDPVLMVGSRCPSWHLARELTSGFSFAGDVMASRTVPRSSSTGRWWRGLVVTRRSRAQGADLLWNGCSRWMTRTRGLTSDPTVRFDQVRLNLGSFLSDFLAPVVANVQRVLDPVQPVLDVLTTPCRCCLSLGTTVTLKDLASLFGPEGNTSPISSGGGGCQLPGEQSECGVGRRLDRSGRVPGGR